MLRAFDNAMDYMETHKSYTLKKLRENFSGKTNSNTQKEK